MVDKVLGAKVRIVVKEEGSYEGFVHNIDQNTNKLTLIKVMSCSTGTRLHGLHHFFPKEITELTVLEQKTKVADRFDAKESPNDKKPTFCDSNLDKTVPVAPDDELPDPGNSDESRGRGFPFKPRRNFSKKRLQKGKMRRDPSDEGPSLLQRKPVKPSNYYSEVFVDTTDDKENLTVNPPDVDVIDSFGETFEKAVAYISRQRVVGVAWEGVKTGRFGNLCLIQIGCNKCIYIFDIVTLGGRAFDCGLADIMDSGDILKVIHNCRHLSDALYHQYGVSLVNVFDTQVADVIIYKNEMDRELPRQTSSLMSSLYEYLDLSPDEFHFHKIRLKFATNDELVWKKRPIHKDLVDVAAKTVMYLRELRLAQMERMMEEFIFGVDIYLSCMRDASDEVVKKKYSSSALPEMFHQLHKRRERPRYRQLEPELDDSHESEDPRHVWEEGQNFLKEYEKRGMRVREHKYPPITELGNTSGELSQENLRNENSSYDMTTAVDQLDISKESVVTPQEQNLHRTENVSNFASTAGRSNMAYWPASEGIFRKDDFPQLSSDSDSSGLSPVPSAMEHRTEMRLSQTNSHEPKRGLGRATALTRNAHLPKARLPAETRRPGLVPSYIGIGNHDRLQFPTDEELLSTPEIVSSSNLRTVPSGSLVRVSYQRSGT